jgi:hypothetical protein
MVYNGLISIRGLMPKKCCLGPQNGFGSSGLEKLPKIVNFATIKATKKLKKQWWGSKCNRRVATNIHLDQIFKILS